MKWFIIIVAVASGFICGYMSGRCKGEEFTNLPDSATNITHLPDVSSLTNVIAFRDMWLAPLSETNALPDVTALTNLNTRSSNLSKLRNIWAEIPYTPDTAAVERCIQRYGANTVETKP